MITLNISIYLVPPVLICTKYVIRLKSTWQIIILTLKFDLFLNPFQESQISKEIEYNSQIMIVSVITSTEYKIQLQ